MVDPFLGFWKTLARPIIALAPMDGVTDFACRAIMARYGRPDVIFTEFTTAEGLFHAPERILRDFEYGEEERPVVAQIYGHRPEDFYRATHVVCELGFDGVDINMGCPAKQVAARSCGAGLISEPELALEIIRATRSAIHDWSNGRTLEQIKVRKSLLETVARMNLKRCGQERPAERRPIPYSVKTRLGHDSVVIERWIVTLLSESPAAISIHGRTLKQMYKGEARWDAIARAAEVARGSGTLILGNGDVKSRGEALRLTSETGVDGILIGRASIGNPWVFAGREAEIEERIRVSLEHAQLFVKGRGERGFNSVKKHLVGYLKGFPEAASLRMSALRTQSLEELTHLLLSRLTQSSPQFDHQEFQPFPPFDATGYPFRR